jgi:ABC-type lipoprotein release transport system permease subunit
MVSKDPEVAPGTIVIGEGISRTRLAPVGDSLEFRTLEGKIVELRISRVFPSRWGLVASDLILISEADFRGLFGIRKGYVTDLALKIRNSRELATIALKAAEALPDTRQILREEILRTYDAIFSWRSGILLAILAGALLAFIILAWDKASGPSLDERGEIGILKAIGWETADVLLMKGWEGLVISLTSFLAGILMAYGHVYFTSFILFEPVLKGWGVLYPQFKLTPAIDATELAALFFLTVAPYSVATIIPAWRAAIVDPDTVMR